jgi:hypothetical protein
VLGALLHRLLDVFFVADVALQRQRLHKALLKPTWPRSKRQAWEKRRYLAASGFDFLGRRVDGAGEGGVRRVGLGGHDDVGALLCGPAQVVG